MFVHLAFWAVVGLGAGPEGLPTIEGSLEPGRTAQVTVPAAGEARGRSFLISLNQPGRLAPAVPFSASLTFGATTLRKTLHLGDPDAAWSIRQPSDTPVRVTLEAGREHKASIAFAIRV